VHITTRTEGAGARRIPCSAVSSYKDRPMPSPFRGFTSSLCVSAAALLLAAGCSPPPSTQTSATPQDVLLGKPFAGHADVTPRDAEGKPLFTGFWKLLREEGKPDGNLGKDLPGFALPYSEAGRKAHGYNVTKTIDPEARCLISGSPRLTTSVLPFEILHTQKRLAFFYYLSWHRWVWLDGRNLEADPDPEYLGNNVGHWDGDTLVIESNGFKDSADGTFWLDDNANPQSAQATLVERWTRPDKQHLNLVLTYTDPVYYTQPVTYTRSWVLAPEGEQLQEFSCEWNTTWVVEHLDPGPGQIGADGNRGFGPQGEVVPSLPLGAVDGADSRGTGYWLYRQNKPKPSDLPEEQAGK
jgi:hypothetical protein